MLNNLATTVHTPPKCVRREAPSITDDRDSTATVVSTPSRPCGYISSVSGVNSQVAPAASALAASPSGSRG